MRWRKIYTIWCSMCLWTKSSWASRKTARIFSVPRKETKSSEACMTLSWETYRRLRGTISDRRSSPIKTTTCSISSPVLIRRGMTSRVMRRISHSWPVDLIRNKGKCNLWRVLRKSFQPFKVESALINLQTKRLRNSLNCKTRFRLR